MGITIHNFVLKCKLKAFCSYCSTSNPGVCVQFSNGHLEWKVRAFTYSKAQVRFFSLFSYFSIMPRITARLYGWSLSLYYHSGTITISTFILSQKYSHIIVFVVGVCHFIRTPVCGSMNTGGRFILWLKNISIFCSKF